MKMTRMLRPCSECPFRTDRGLYLSAARAEEIANALLSDRSFACHKTTSYGDVDVDGGGEGEGDVESEGDVDTSQASFCAGALGTMVNGQQHFNNVLVRLLAMRREKGDTWPVSIERDSLYPSLAAWVAAHKQEGE